MYLFIFESIGTQELILIAVVAMIFFGPRRIPEMARKFGKLMADFRNTTNEFKATWEREVNFEEEKNALLTGDIPPAPVARTENIIERSEPAMAPEVRSMDAEEVRAALPQTVETPPQPETQTNADDSGKRDWL